MLAEKSTSKLELGIRKGRDTRGACVAVASGIRIASPVRKLWQGLDLAESICLSGRLQEYGRRYTSHQGF